MRKDKLIADEILKKYAESEQIKEETEKMIMKMNDDITKIIELERKESKSEEFRRMAVRTIFSDIEGICFLMKVNALLLGQIKNIDFRREEIALINEESYYLANNGKVKTGRAYLDSKSNFRFAFKILARAKKSDFELDVSGTEWNNYQEALRIRNRITHPKKLEDMIISEEDYEKAFKVYGWFRDSIEQLLKQSKPQKKEV